MSLLMHKDREPTDWDNMFFSEAVLWSRRSHDSQTQCGCVLVKNKTVIATGYNGFMREIDDSSLPSTRPEKYPFMIHAEANAVYNCAREGKSTLGCRAYITAPAMHYMLANVVAVRNQRHILFRFISTEERHLDKQI